MYAIRSYYVYPSSSGLWHAIKERMNIYMRDVLHIPEDEVPALREQYYKMYGTTLRGFGEQGGKGTVALVLQAAHRQQRVPAER